MNSSIRVLLFLSLAFVVGSYSGCKNEPKTIAKSTAGRVHIPEFNGDNAYAHIEKQLSFGYRIPGTEGQKAFVEWSKAELKSLGAKVHVQEFKVDFQDKKRVDAYNVMAQFNPEHQVRVLLAAHFDSRMIADKEEDEAKKKLPIMGADDGASGVAVLMELARLLSENPIDLGVDILFFDAEDQGDNTYAASWCLGSQYWSRNLMPSGYKAKFGILLDMVGAKDATFGQEETSLQFAPGLVDKVWTLAARMGYSDYFQSFLAGAVTDDHYWVNRIARIPMIDIINQKPEDRRSFGFYHHTLEDNIDVISQRTLKVVGQVVTAVIYKESEGSL